jgi:hypothetical protein
MVPTACSGTPRYEYLNRWQVPCQHREEKRTCAALQKLILNKQCVECFCAGCLDVAEKVSRLKVPAMTNYAGQNHAKFAGFHQNLQGFQGVFCGQLSAGAE